MTGLHGDWRYTAGYFHFQQALCNFRAASGVLLSMLDVAPYLVAKETAVRKWAPLAALALVGVGALLLSERGRASLRLLGGKLENAPDALLEWNDALLSELGRLQAAVDRVADSLPTAN